MKAFNFKTLAAIAACFVSVGAWATAPDSTLRIDYVFSGKPGDVGISLRSMSKWARWGGRTSHMAQTPRMGDGDVTVTTLDGDTLYRQSFSSLFSEWLGLGDDQSRNCEHSVLVPMPTEDVLVTTRLLDKRHETVAEMSHLVKPSDILIRKAPQPFPHKYVHRGNYDGQKIGVAILGEGYSAEEMNQFHADAAEAVQSIMAHEPFGKYSDRFDFIAVETPSEESGLSIPKIGEWKNTAFGSHYSTFYSDRYLTSPDVFAIYDALRGIPAQHVIILANTEQYGGGGIFNCYTLTSARHDKRWQVTPHEFGHSFGGLGDEYFYDNEPLESTYPKDVEPWEPNITTLVDFADKWQALIPEGVPVPTDPADSAAYPIGVYEGGGYLSHGIYRPAFDCRMRTNESPAFCPACQDALEKIILFYTEPD